MRFVPAFSCQPQAQALLRGVEPGSFPSCLAATATKDLGQRRFVVMDDNVYKLYGAQVRQVRRPIFVLILIYEHFSLFIFVKPL